MIGSITGVSFNPIYKEIAAYLDYGGFVNLIKVDYSNNSFEILSDKEIDCSTT
jgi:hypothetical protein